MFLLSSLSRGITGLVKRVLNDYVENIQNVFIRPRFSHLSVEALDIAFKADSLQALGLPIQSAFIQKLSLSIYYGFEFTPSSLSIEGLTIVLLSPSSYNPKSPASTTSSPTVLDERLLGIILGASLTIKNTRIVSNSFVFSISELFIKPTVVFSRSTVQIASHTLSLSKILLHGVGNLDSLLCLCSLEVILNHITQNLMLKIPTLGVSINLEILNLFVSEVVDVVQKCASLFSSSSSSASTSTHEIVTQSVEESIESTSNLFTRTLSLLAYDDVDFDGSSNHWLFLGLKSAINSVDSNHFFDCLSVVIECISVKFVHLNATVSSSFDCTLDADFDSSTQLISNIRAQSRFELSLLLSGNSEGIVVSVPSILIDFYSCREFFSLTLLTSKSLENIFPEHYYSFEFAFPKKFTCLLNTNGLQSFLIGRLYLSINRNHSLSIDLNSKINHLSNFQPLSAFGSLSCSFSSKLLTPTFDCELSRVFLKIFDWGISVKTLVTLSSRHHSIQSFLINPVFLSFLFEPGCSVRLFRLFSSQLTVHPDLLIDHVEFFNQFSQEISSMTRVITSLFPYQESAHDLLPLLSFISVSKVTVISRLLEPFPIPLLSNEIPSMVQISKLTVKTNMTSLISSVDLISFHHSFLIEPLITVDCLKLNLELTPSLEPVKFDCSINLIESAFSLDQFSVFSSQPLILSILSHRISYGSTVLEPKKSVLLNPDVQSTVIDDVTVSLIVVDDVSMTSYASINHLISDDVVNHLFLIPWTVLEKRTVYLLSSSNSIIFDYSQSNIFEIGPITTPLSQCLIAIKPLSLVANFSSSPVKNYQSNSITFVDIFEPIPSTFSSVPLLKTAPFSFDFNSLVWSNSIISNHLLNVDRLAFTNGIGIYSELPVILNFQSNLIDPSCSFLTDQSIDDVIDSIKSSNLLISISETIFLKEIHSSSGWKVYLPVEIVITNHFQSKPLKFLNFELINSINDIVIKPLFLVSNHSSFNLVYNIFLLPSSAPKFPCSLNCYSCSCVWLILPPFMNLEREATMVSVSDALISLSTLFLTVNQSDSSTVNEGLASSVDAWDFYSYSFPKRVYGHALLAGKLNQISNNCFLFGGKTGINSLKTGCLVLSDAPVMIDCPASQVSSIVSLSIGSVRVKSYAFQTVPTVNFLIDRFQLSIDNHNQSNVSISSLFVKTNDPLLSIPEQTTLTLTLPSSCSSLNSLLKTLQNSQVYFISANVNLSNLEITPHKSHLTNILQLRKYLLRGQNLSKSKETQSNLIEKMIAVSLLNISSFSITTLFSSTNSVTISSEPIEIKNTLLSSTIQLVRKIYIKNLLLSAPSTTVALVSGLGSAFVTALTRKVLTREKGVKKEHEERIVVERFKIPTVFQSNFDWTRSVLICDGGVLVFILNNNIEIKSINSHNTLQIGIKDYQKYYYK
ncbi:hypothetical protein RCL1_001198 [Eukaryota sp. TZLM3-RCL]